MACDFFQQPEMQSLGRLAISILFSLYTAAILLIGVMAAIMAAPMEGPGPVVVPVLLATGCVLAIGALLAIFP